MLPEGASQDRVAIVTGSATGIGWAIANTLSHLGAGVVIASRHEGVVRSAADDIEEASGDVLGCRSTRARPSR